MLPNPYQQYQRTSVQTASRGDLVVMLYEGAIAFIGRGCLHLERSEPAQAHAMLMRAQDVIVELRSTLDMAAGGKLAVQLDRIYQYLLDRLVEANIKKDDRPAQEAAALLRELLPAWKVAANPAPASGPAAAGVARVPALAR